MNLSPLYAILDLESSAVRGVSAVALCRVWLDAGVRLIQLRAKATPSGEFLRLAARLAALVAEAGGTFIVNDRVDVARLSGATGVHVGQTDLSPADARLILGVAAVVGVSTHTESQAARAIEEPIDYLAIGPVFATSSKRFPDPVVGIEGVRRAVALDRRNQVPVVAIGGITLDRAAEVRNAGAASVAVISDLLEGDLAARAHAFMAAVQ